MRKPALIAASLLLFSALLNLFQSAVIAAQMRALFGCVQ